MRKEYGNKMMFTSLIYQFVLAWIGAFIVRIIGGAIFSHSPASLTEFVIAGIILLASTIILLRMFNKNHLVVVAALAVVAKVIVLFK